MRLSVLFAISCIALTGCGQVFAPRATPDIVMNLTQANQSLSKIAACVELGTCKGRATFSKVEKTYVDAFAAVNTAKRMADALDPGKKKAPEAKELFVAEIQRCEDAIKDMHDAHRRFPTIQGAGLTTPTLMTCDVPLASAKALS